MPAAAEVSAAVVAVAASVAAAAFTVAASEAAEQPFTAAVSVAVATAVRVATIAAVAAAAANVTNATKRICNPPQTEPGQPGSVFFFTRASQANFCPNCSAVRTTRSTP